MGITPIKPECGENALGILRGPFSQFLGCCGATKYYTVDGKVWAHTLTSRGDSLGYFSHEEGEEIRKALLARGATHD